MSTEKIQLEYGLLSRSSFAIVTICYWAQAILGAIFWWLTIKPLLLLIRQKEGRSKNSPAHKIDQKHLRDRIIWRALSACLRAHLWISGVRKVQDTYGRLLEMSSRVPFIGYKQGKLIHSIEVLGPLREDSLVKGQQVQTWDLTWVNRVKAMGRFRVVSKDLIEGASRIRLCAVWTTGTKVGLLFSISGPAESMSLDELKDLLDDESAIPTNVYLPPRILELLLEIAFSIGSILVVAKGFYEVFVRYAK